MNWADKSLLILFLAGILTWQALHQAKLFKQNITISHFWKGLAYVGAIVLATIPFVAAFGWWYLLKIPIIAILERMAIFDFILNVARSKPIFYNGDKTTGSWIDKLENNMSEAAIPAYKIGWLLIFILVIIFIK